MTDDVHPRLRAYARLLVHAGVNLAQGQELLVHAQHEHAPFVRAIAEEAYAAGELGESAADALKAEARRRVTAGEFFGHIAYASLIARRSEA